MEPWRHNRVAAPTPDAPRYLGYQLVAEVSIGFGDERVDVGEVTIGSAADTLWVKVTQLGGVSPWPFSYGLLSWESYEGRELGTAKAYGRSQGEVYRLSVGRQPAGWVGRLIFEPRHWNSRWVRAEGQPWQLRFEVASGSGGGGGVSGFAGGFVTAQGAGLELARVVFP